MDITISILSSILLVIMYMFTVKLQRKYNNSKTVSIYNKVDIYELFNSNEIIFKKYDLKLNDKIIFISNIKQYFYVVVLTEENKLSLSNIDFIKN